MYRVGDLHFVMDGHHCVSVAVATGHKAIDAQVTEVLARKRAGRDDVPLVACGRP
ncbi:MAG TPA: hypothetical protein VGO89_11005 [Streptomyces sp.]|nr:hypothetical protein [Streptomyces sp.]